MFEGGGGRDAKKHQTEKIPYDIANNGIGNIIVKNSIMTKIMSKEGHLLPKHP